MTLALIGLLFAAGAFAIAVVLPVLSFLRTSRALREAERAHERIEALARVVQDLARERRESAAPVTSTAHVEPAAASATRPQDRDAGAAAPAPDAATLAPAGAGVSADILETSPASPLAPGPASAPAAPPPLPSATQESPAAALPAVVPAAAVRSDVLRGTDQAVPPRKGDAAAQPTRVPQPPHRGPGATPHAHRGPTLEQRIGKRWMLYVGIGAIVLGASYLVKLAFDNDWITPAMRVGLSALGGAALIALGLRFAGRGLAAFGHLLAGGGFAVLYVAIYAALNYYDLIGRGPAFACMVAVTAFAGWLADRRSALGLAMVALIGGFATPFLVGGDRDAFLALFTYITVLAASATVLARRHGWPLLTLTAFALTALTFGTWAVEGYRHDHYLVVQAFLTVWLALFMVAIKAPGSGEQVTPFAATSLRDPSDAMSAGVGVIVGIVAPLLYHAASLSNLVRHTQALLIYFILVTLCAVVFAAEGRRTWLRLLGWLAAWLPFLGWLSQHPSAAGARATLFALFGLHLLAELRMLARDRERLDTIDTLLIHLNGLGLLAGLLLLFPRWDTPGMAAVTAGVALGYAGLALGTRTRHESAPLHYVALASACAAGALALRFDGAWVTTGWAVEGAFLIWLGLRERRDWLRGCGGVLLAMATWYGLEWLDRDTGVARTAFLNTSALSVAAIAALLGWVAYCYSRTTEPLRRGPATPIAVALLTAAVLVGLVITNEINRLFGVYAWRQDVEAGAMAGGSADLARQVTLSIAWAAYAVTLVAVGIARRYAPIRYLAIAMLTGTIAKVFLVDLARLDRVYRVLSVIGLGVLLILASYLYQRFMADEDGDATDGPAEGAPAESPDSGRQ